MKPKCLDRVRTFVLGMAQPSFTTRETARWLGLTAGEVQHAFHFLNLEGILTQAIKPLFLDMKSEAELRDEPEEDHYDRR